MIHNKKTIKYVVRYGFVDDTYWDDGNRFTNRTKTFPTWDEAFKFYKTIHKGWVSEVSRVTDKTQMFYVEWIKIYRQIRDRITPTQENSVKKYEDLKDERKANS